LGLLDAGWALNDIDEMDIMYYIDLLIYKAKKEYKKQAVALDDAGL
jgi:hypothetical protein